LCQLPPLITARRCFFVSSLLDILFLLENKYAGPSKALPRCALPKYLIEELQKHIPNAIFVSNPCRFVM